MQQKVISKKNWNPNPTQLQDCPHFFVQHTFLGHFRPPPPPQQIGLNTPLSENFSVNCPTYILGISDHSPVPSGIVAYVTLTFQE